MSYTQLIYHIVIRTKHSQPTIVNEHSEKLYSYIYGFVKNKKSTLYRINGMPDHIHILVGLHSSLSLSDFIRTLKTTTNFWIKHSGMFPDFQSWGEKYGAFTLRYQEKNRVIAYIKNQREHHKQEDFVSEYRRLIVDNGIKIDERYFLDD